MTNSKNTKRALLASALSILMCVAMLIGTTFAWFTDTASTGVNKIQAGNLKVDIVGKDDASLDGKTLYFRDKDGKTDILWEPGATFNLDAFKIVNKGNLALKYKVLINGVEGDAKLLEAIDFTMKNGSAEPVVLSGWEGVLLPVGKTPAADNETVGATDFITISATMKKEAGNEYQGLSISGIGIAVYAAQYTYENDSFDNQYDKDAAYDTTKFRFVDSAETLKAVAATAQPGDEIQLTQDITLNDTVVFDVSKITINGNGHTITADMSDAEVDNLKTLLRFGHDTVYCTGVTVKNLTFAGKGGRAIHFHGGTSSLLENVKISGNWSLPINFYGTHGAVMNNCDISSTCENKYAKSSVFANEQSANQIILNNTKIDSIFVNASAAGAAYANDGIKIVVNDGSTVGVLYTNQGITRPLYRTNGNGSVGEVLFEE